MFALHFKMCKQIQTIPYQSCLPRRKISLFHKNMLFNNIKIIFFIWDEYFSQAQKSGITLDVSFQFFSEIHPPTCKLI